MMAVTGRQVGRSVPRLEGAAKVTGRVPCSACGLSKRHLFDKASGARLTDPC